MPETNNIIFQGKSFWNSRELTSTVMFMMTMNCVVADDFAFRISALQGNLSLPALKHSHELHLPSWFAEKTGAAFSASVNSSAPY